MNDRKPILNVDMDDTMYDFFGATKCIYSKTILEYKMWDKDFFLNLKPLPGAQGAIFELLRMGFDVRVLSQPLAESPESYSDKVKSVSIHFPQLYNKIILTQDKGLCLGDYLIDDNLKWKEPFEKNGGKFIHFSYGGHTYKDRWEECPDPEQSWRQIVEYFRSLKETGNV
jgi:5'(3')-deoxyribonucleotidase